MNTKKIVQFKYIFTKIIGFCVLVLGVIQIFIANGQSASGIKVKNFDVEVDKLILENKELENKIARESSLKLIEKKAIKLGLTKKANFVFLNKPLPIAYQR